MGGLLFLGVVCVWLCLFWVVYCFVFFVVGYATNWYECCICSSSCWWDRLPLSVMVFQCFLFIWYPGVMVSGCCSRNSIAFSGLHLTLNLMGVWSMLTSKNILLLTLNARVCVSKGKLSVTFGKVRQWSRNCSMSIFGVVWGYGLWVAGFEGVFWWFGFCCDVCVDLSRACVDLSRACVDLLWGCVDLSRGCVDLSRGCVDLLWGCVDLLWGCVDLL